jgi:hypothetical protein
MIVLHPAALGSGLAVAGLLTIAAFGFSSPPPMSGTCSTTPTQEVGTVDYWTCTAPIGWNGYGPPANPKDLTFHGAQFSIYGYPTFEGSAVRVNGTEPSGSQFQLIIESEGPTSYSEYPSPQFTPDQDCGIEWTGGSSVTLLVQVP